MTDLTAPQRIERARRAKAAMDEFLAPALAHVEADYAEKMIAVAASTDPRAPDAIARLANGIKVARQVRAHVETFIADGAVAQSGIERADRIGSLTEPKRRLIGVRN